MTEIRSLLKTDKLVLGTDRTMKRLKAGKLKKIFVTANCPAKIKENIKYYTDMSKIEVVDLKQQNDELGVLCRKPFSISVLGLEE